MVLSCWRESVTDGKQGGSKMSGRVIRALESERLDAVKRANADLHKGSSGNHGYWTGVADGLRHAIELVRQGERATIWVK